MGHSIMFADRVRRVRYETDEIARALRGVDHLVTMDDYDLRRSAENLREAADKIDAIRARHTPVTTPHLIAAE